MFDLSAEVLTKADNTVVFRNESQELEKGGRRNKLVPSVVKNHDGDGE
jgi:hypothetical protein